jgi:hypothetical protein
MHRLPIEQGFRKKISHLSWQKKGKFFNKKLYWRKKDCDIVVKRQRTILANNQIDALPLTL